MSIGANASSPATCGSTSRCATPASACPADKQWQIFGAVRAGRRLDDAQVRRHRPGPDDLGRAGRADARPHLDRQRRRPAAARSISARVFGARDVTPRRLRRAESVAAAGGAPARCRAGRCASCWPKTTPSTRRWWSACSPAAGTRSSSWTTAARPWTPCSAGVRRRADGHPDARDGRARGDGRDSRCRTRRRPPHADHRDDRARDDRRPRAVPGGGHGRLRRQADSDRGLFATIAARPSPATAASGGRSGDRGRAASCWRTALPATRRCSPTSSTPSSADAPDAMRELARAIEAGDLALLTRARAQDGKGTVGVFTTGPALRGGARRRDGGTREPISARPAPRSRAWSARGGGTQRAPARRFGAKRLQHQRTRPRQRASCASRYSLPIRYSFFSVRMNNDAVGDGRRGQRHLVQRVLRDLLVAVAAFDDDRRAFFVEEVESLPAATGEAENVWPTPPTRALNSSRPVSAA